MHLVVTYAFIFSYEEILSLGFLMKYVVLRFICVISVTFCYFICVLCWNSSKSGRWWLDMIMAIFWPVHCSIKDVDNYQLWKFLHELFIFQHYSASSLRCLSCFCWFCTLCSIFCELFACSFSTWNSVLLWFLKFD